MIDRFAYAMVAFVQLVLALSMIALIASMFAESPYGTAVFLVSMGAVFIPIAISEARH